MVMSGERTTQRTQSMALLGEDVDVTEVQDPETIITDLAEGQVPVSKLRRAAACLNVLAEYGLEKASVWELAKLWKTYRIESVGYRQYLHEVLGTGAKCRLADCRLWKGEQELDLVNLSYWPGKPLVEYLCFLASDCDNVVDDLPDRVECQRSGATLTSYI